RRAQIFSHRRELGRAREPRRAGESVTGADAGPEFYGALRRQPENHPLKCRRSLGGRRSGLRKSQKITIGKWETAMKKLSMLLSAAAGLTMFATGALA